MTLVNPQSTRFKDLTRQSRQYNRFASSAAYEDRQSTRAKATKVSSTVEGSR